MTFFKWEVEDYFLSHLNLNRERKDKGGDIISEPSGQLACVF